MSEKSFKIVGNDMSDGYHTFDELYEHRCRLFIALCLAQPEKCVWKNHYPGWPVLFLQTPKGQVSYHVPERLTGYFATVIRQDETHEWDGHTSADVLDRLLTPTPTDPAAGFLCEGE
jgi:hypothetical protein